MTSPRRLLLVTLLSGSLLMACTPSGSTGSGQPSTPAQQEQPSATGSASALRFITIPPADGTVVVPTTDAAAAALEASRRLFADAPVVVLAAAGDAAAVGVATDLHAPLLISGGDPAGLTDEVTRLGARAALTLGPVPAEAVGAVQAAGAEVVDTAEDLPRVEAADPLDDVLVLVDGQPWTAPVVASARAAGAAVWAVPGGDPRAEPAVVDALAQRPPTGVIAFGDVFGQPEGLRLAVDVAATGVHLPGGGQVLFPHRRVIALYGHPGTSALGVLGEQPVEEAVERARRVAADYETLSDVPVVPAFEIITTIASADAGADGDYSAESSAEKIRPWVDAAGEAGLYVLLDLQPGRTDFLTQAQRYADLLLEPHVGLALDPEWRLGASQRHLEQIGSVTVEEVNAVAEWLAGLTREHRLPQKMLVLHQFRLSMLPGRERLDTSHDELAVVLHADGNGTPQEKLETWNALRANPPDGVHWAWKNFYDEDTPTFTPERTMGLDPAPVLVSYQ